MKKLTLERQNNKSYLVARVSEGSVVDEDCLATISEEKGARPERALWGWCLLFTARSFRRGR